jgi:hypothetical protein
MHLNKKKGLQKPNVKLYDRDSRRRGSGSAMVAMVHGMARSCYIYILSRSEPYQGENRGLKERKLRNTSKKVNNSLRN